MATVRVPICCGSYYYQGAFVEFPHLGNSNLGQLPHGFVTVRASLWWAGDPLIEGSCAALKTLPMLLVSETEVF